MHAVRHIANFVYPALVVFKGKRLEQRVSLRAPMEYAFAAVASSETTPEAVVTLNKPKKTGPEVRSSYLGWKGRLWEPLRDPDTQDPVTMDVYLRRLGDPAHQVRYRDPFWFGHDRRVWRADDAALDEEAVVGRTVWSDRAAAMRRHGSACERILIVDDVVHERTEGPVWCHYASTRFFDPSPDVASLSWHGIIICWIFSSSGRTVCRPLSGLIVFPTRRRGQTA